MAITRLGLYNKALQAIGERALTSIDEDVEARRALDEAWTSGGGSGGNSAIRYCLEQGFWKHAMRAVKSDAASGITPSFGFTYAFAKPSDFVQIDMLSADDRFGVPLTRYEFEGDYLYADHDPIYMRFVSDDASWGADLSRWPESFSQWVGVYLATLIAPRLKNDLDMDRLEKREMRLLADARSKDARLGPTRDVPMGNFASARFGRRWTGRADRGPRNRLLS